MTGLIIALQFLTRLPMPAVKVNDEAFARSMRWFPAVGLVVGVIVAAGGWAACRIDTWTAALVALVLWVAVTGAMHLDGLADIADARGAAHKNREHLLRVLADPHLGSFGVVAVGLQLLAKFVLLHAALDHGLFVPLALIPFAARLGPLAWARQLPLLHDGLGARFRHAVRPVDLALWGAVALLALPWSVSLIVVLPFVTLWGWWLARQIGGISGDGHGAGIELGETVLLIALVVGGSLS